MSKKQVPAVSQEEILRQKNIIKSINAALMSDGKVKKAFVWVR